MSKLRLKACHTKMTRFFYVHFAKNGFTKFNRRLNDKIRLWCYDIGDGILTHCIFCSEHKGEEVENDFIYE